MSRPIHGSAVGATAPPRPDKIFGLDLRSAHLVLLCTLPDLRDQRLLLLLQLDSDLVELTDGLVEGPLVLAQPLGGRHALAESPF